MLHKIGTPHIHTIPLHYVRQEKTIVVLVVTTRQEGEPIPRIIVREDTNIDFGDDVTIIVCLIIFSVRLARYVLSTKHTKSKYLCEQ
jgi:hypothetical protein